MNTSKYKHPPLMQAYAGHAVGTAILGALLPSGEHLDWLHRLMIPIVELIPNAARITSRAPDPVFAQAFIGLSILIAALVLLTFVIFIFPGYHTKTFHEVFKRRIGLLYLWFIAIVILSFFWLIPYLDPLSKGQLYYLQAAALSGKVGVLVVINQLTVGFPLSILLFLGVAHRCTSAVNGY